MRLPALARALIIAAVCAAPAYADGPAVATPDVAAPPVAPPAAQAPVRAAPVPAEPAATPAPVGQTGAITLPGSTGLAINVPQGYRYYTADEARGFLQRSGAANPQGDILGLLLPAGADPRAPDVWGTVVSYQPIGHISSASASQLTAPTLEADVRAARVGQNRPFEGFAAVPSYAEAGPTLSWAERSAAPGSGGRDLRHEQRLLGRNGVAGLTTVGSADQLGAVTAAAPDMLTMVAFGAGQRHSDFNAQSDRASDWTLPMLVTGNAPADPQAEAAMVAAGPTDTTQTGGGLLGGMFPWIAAGVAALAGVGYMVARAMNRGRREEADYDDGEDPNLTPSERT